MAKKAKKDPEKSQKSVYLPDRLWERINERGKPMKQSASNVIELILEKEFA